MDKSYKIQLAFQNYSRGKMEFKFNQIIIDKKNPLKNFLNIDGIDYQFLYINPDYDGNKGGNSFIFLLRSSEYYDRVIKISKTRLELNSEFAKKNKLRFEREIEALKISKTKEYIIEYLFDGEIEIDGNKFRFYIMEKADTDLKDFILTEQPVLSTRFRFCIDILKAFSELKSLDIYHRDIKPDNFFLIDSTIKVGDLGLIKYRTDDVLIDAKNEMIGPRGWMSPESMNKALTFERDLLYKYDCNIDFQSDVFQLGKLFWFIFQYNVPIGRIQKSDFNLYDDQLYDILLAMLFHDKKARPNIEELLNIFSQLSQKHPI